MEPNITENLVQASTGKKRIPKACNACRQSKVKCDEQRPTCTRCHTLKKTCIYVEKPKSAEEQKIQDLEQEVLLLREQLSARVQDQSTSITARSTLPSRTSEIRSPQSVASITQSSPSIGTDRPLKRKRSHFQMQKELSIPGFVDEGMLSEQQAMIYFDCFFSGCDRYVPIFDSSDTFTSVKSRSSLLLNTICAMGCGVTGDGIIDSRMLHVRLKRWLTTVVLSPYSHSLETIQALLVMACWWSERSLLLAIATRMAVELQLDDAFDELVNLSLTQPTAPDCHILMRKARTWALLWNLQQILQVDAGNLLGLKVRRVRRCRALLDKPFSTKLDARLFSQVELNSIRIKVSETLTRESDDLFEAVQDARVNIAIWFDDWKRIIETSPISGSETSLLMTNLTIQRHWADAMAACRAVRIAGVNNIDMMSTDQMQTLSMAKDALQNHLDVMLTRPHYLANFKFAMDFVWAKCAFSFLLLLKLNILLSQESSQQLLEQGRSLHAELSKSCGHESSKVYLRLLQLSLEKYASRESSQSVELDTFIPEEFIFEWDFPGLNLFSSPTGWELLFDQYSLGDDLFVGIYD